MVVRLFLAVPRGCPQFVIVVFPDHTYLLLSITRERASLVFRMYGNPDELTYGQESNLMRTGGPGGGMITSGIRGGGGGGVNNGFG